jgi:hypothetical protein
MSEAPQPAVWTPEQARALVAVLDAALPPSADGRLPGAGELGLLARIEAEMRRSPELGAAVRDGLAGLDALARGRAAPGFAELPAPEREPVLRELAERQPGFLPGLLFHAFAAYYQHPRVLAGLGLEPRPPFPKGYAMEPSDLDALLAPVRRRGPLWRPAR